MNFNSLSFLIFLPITVFLYWVLPHRFRWIMLLAASYFFYMSWNVWLGFLMFVTCLVAYLCSLLISRTEKKKVKKLGLAIAVVFCLGVLIFFKYINFLLKNLTGVIRLFGGEIDDISLNIPSESRFIRFRRCRMSSTSIAGISRRRNTSAISRCSFRFFPNSSRVPSSVPANFSPN